MANEELKIIGRAQACMHFQSKGMYIYSEMPGMDLESGEHDGYAWCQLTQRQLGPDREPVERASCGPGRGCYQVL